MTIPGDSIPPEVLVVDDTPANLQLLSGMLKDCGYKVRLALNGELALQSARRSPPDLILLDINMPGLSGYEVAGELKRDPALAKIPVIFISALAETLDKIARLHRRRHGYVTKPFHFEEVAARIKTHLQIRQLQMELERRNQELQQSNDELRRLQELRDNLVHADNSRPELATQFDDWLHRFVPVQRRKESFPSGAKDLSTALAAANKMAAMVRSLLDVSKMEAGQLKLHRTDCDLAALGREVFAMYESLRKTRRFAMDAPEKPLLASADRDLISRVLQNLVGNALKYAPEESTVRSD